MELFDHSRRSRRPGAGVVAGCPSGFRDPLLPRLLDKSQTAANSARSTLCPASRPDLIAYIYLVLPCPALPCAPVPPGKTTPPSHSLLDHFLSHVVILISVSGQPTPKQPPSCLSSTSRVPSAPAQPVCPQRPLPLQASSLRRAFPLTCTTSAPTR